MLVWSRTFLPPYPFPQWAMCFPLSLTFARTPRWPLLFGCSRFRRAQTTGGLRAHPFVGQRRSQEKGGLWTVRPISNKSCSQPNKSQLPVLISRTDRFYSAHKGCGQMLALTSGTYWTAISCSLWGSQGSITWGPLLSDHRRKLRNMISDGWALTAKGLKDSAISD